MISKSPVSAVDGVHFCDPIGHRQEDGDYRESWQPQQMSTLALERAQEIARKTVLALGGYGLFGVELFVCGDEVIFSEVSPRPHDTGMVTLISQDLSEFALHVRAFLGLPIGAIRQYGPAASAVILGITLTTPWRERKRPLRTSRLQDKKTGRKARFSCGEWLTASHLQPLREPVW